MRSIFCCLMSLIPLFGSDVLAGAPKFSQPIDCLGQKNCAVQYYHDVDPGQGGVDYRCGRLTRDKALFVRFVGKTLRAETDMWPTGRYRGRINIIRAGKQIRSSSVELDL